MITQDHIEVSTLYKNIVNLIEKNPSQYTKRRERDMFVSTLYDLNVLKDSVLPSLVDSYPGGYKLTQNKVSRSEAEFLPVETAALLEIHRKYFSELKSHYIFLGSFCILLFLLTISPLFGIGENNGTSRIVICVILLFMSIINIVLANSFTKKLDGQEGIIWRIAQERTERIKKDDG